MTDTAYTADVAFYIKHIDAYDRAAQKWVARSKKIIDRYMDTQDKRAASQFNILWSNVQTLAPAAYASPPKPNIDRRFQDEDELSNVVAQVLERCVSYYVGEDVFNSCMEQSVLDRLLCGRATSWIRYCPQIEDEAVQVTEDNQADSTVTQQSQPVMYGEDVTDDYVHWEDFGHNVARTWQEVSIVWRVVWLTRPQLVERFGKDGNKIPLQDKKEDGEDKSATLKAKIYEIWDKSQKKAMWLSRDWPKFLDELPDPLGLKDFFPCPKPMYATLSNGSLMPTPDYVIYQDQARELDEVTARITKITKALKVAGVYDSSAEGVQRLLQQNVDNQLIPVSQWAVFGEKGGLKGVIDLLPLDMIVNALAALYAAREQIKQVIYEITGLSDIIRGASEANETATAQNIKGKFASLRLDNIQKEVARYARDKVRIMAEIIAEHFDIETIKQVSGFKLLTQAEKMQIQQAMAQYQAISQQAQMAQQPPPPPPVPKEQLKLLDQPTWEEVEAVLRNDMIRSFKVDIETDSTIKLDQDEERQNRIEFVGAVGGYLQQMATVPPQLLPLAGEMLAFAARGFKIGRSMESTIQSALDKLREDAENPQPNAEQIAAQEKAKEQERQMQADAAKQQQEDARFNQEMQYKDKELDLRNRELGAKEKEAADSAALEHKRLDNERINNRLTAKSAAQGDEALLDPDYYEGKAPLESAVEAIAATVQTGMEAIAKMNADNTATVIQAMNAPRTVTTPEGRTYTSKVG